VILQLSAERAKALVDVTLEGGRVLSLATLWQARLASLRSPIFSSWSVDAMFRQRTKALGPVSSLVLLAAILAYLPVSIGGQEIERPGESGLLPRTTGEPLTVVPTDMPDVVCSVADWKTVPEPALTVLCPPEDTFAPLHVFLKLSWLKPQDVPASVRGIIAAPKTPTKLRANKTAIWVWLGVQESSGGAPRTTWVAFNGVVDMALLTLPSNSLRRKPVPRRLELQLERKPWAFPSKYSRQAWTESESPAPVVRSERG
jgi:hypothetical protein